MKMFIALLLICISSALYAEDKPAEPSELKKSVLELRDAFLRLTNAISKNAESKKDEASAQFKTDADRVSKKLDAIANDISDDTKSTTEQARAGLGKALSEVGKSIEALGRKVSHNADNKK